MRRDCQILEQKLHTLAVVFILWVSVTRKIMLKLKLSGKPLGIIRIFLFLSLKNIVVAKSDKMLAVILLFLQQCSGLSKYTVEIIL